MSRINFEDALDQKRMILTRKYNPKEALNP
jgi:hypothetical protein